MKEQPIWYNRRMNKPSPVEPRFWPKVVKGEDPNSCWQWIGAKSVYGMISFEGKNENAHRVSYILKNGKVPPGLQIDHLCRNKLCVNPDHLEAVTGRTNTLRANGPTKVNAMKTHCWRGHEFTKENTRLQKSKYGFHRVCKKCNHINLVNWRAKNR